MPHINAGTREIVFKLVYYGPAMSGKTTNLVQLHRRIAAGQRGEMLVLDTVEERTLFFDFFPLELGTVAGYAVRFHLYTVPGQLCYEASRRVILFGADGITFVADSQPARLEENVACFRAMEDTMRSWNQEPRSYPLVLQYNKRDCEGSIPLGTLEGALGLDGVPAIEAVATEGRGVMETARHLSRALIERFEL